MIRCRRHLCDLTSTKGVCASCLRQRLFALQHEPQNDIITPPSPPASQPVSPHLKSPDEVQSEEQQTQMFFTPQQHDSTTTVVVPVVTVVEEEEESTTKKATTKNSISNMIMGLFRSKKHDHEKKETRNFSVDENARGMSPDRENYCVAGSCKQTPRRTPRRNNRHSMNVSGLAICLSPLIRASPNVRCGGGQAEFCKNRSRKLADFGKNNNKY